MPTMSASWKDLARDADDRHRVHVGVGDGGDQVRRTRTGRRDGDSDLVGCRCIAFGGMARTLLVAHQDVAQLGGVHERVVDGEDRAAREPEDVFDAQQLE